MLLDPLISFDAISQDELNWALMAWDHKMGPLTRIDLSHSYAFGGCA